MITNLRTPLEAGKSYLLFFDIPSMTPYLLKLLSDSSAMKNMFIAEYQKTSDFDLLDSSAKNIDKTPRNQFLSLIRVESSQTLMTVAATIVSVAFMVLGVAMPFRFKYAEESTVGS